MPQVFRDNIGIQLFSNLWYSVRRTLLSLDAFHRFQDKSAQNVKTVCHMIDLLFELQKLFKIAFCKSNIAFYNCLDYKILICLKRSFLQTASLVSHADVKSHFTITQKTSCRFNPASRFQVQRYYIPMWQCPIPWKRAPGRDPL